MSEENKTITHLVNYQLCPKCNGQGIVSNHLMIDGTKLECLSKESVSDQEIKERERLLELQAVHTRYFTQEEFDRLKYLSEKFFNIIKPKP